MRFTIVPLVLASVLIAGAQTTPQPAVSAITGTVADKGQVTFSGSAFGSAPTPLKFDDFESGTVGSRIGAGWNVLKHEPPTFRSPTYSDRVVRPNSKRSVRANFSGGAWNSSFGVTGRDLRTVYVDAWYYYDAADPPSRNHKVLRFHAKRNREPNMGLTMFCQGGSSIIQSDGVKLAKDESFAYVPLGPDTFRHRWSHLQIYVKQSSAGVADGTLMLWVNGKLRVNRRGNWRTRDAGQPLWDTVWLGNYMAHGAAGNCPASGDGYTYWDHVYISTSRARVEIGDAPDYASTKHREIQTPTEWSAGRVTITLRQGAFSNLDGKYLFVTNAAGQTSKGYPLKATAAPSPASVAPASPTNLRVVG
jgi:hypothetical protein